MLHSLAATLQGGMGLSGSMRHGFDSGFHPGLLMSSLWTWSRQPTSNQARRTSSNQSNPSSRNAHCLGTPGTTTHRMQATQGQMQTHSLATD